MVIATHRLARLGFEATGRISLNPKRATESSQSLAPSQDWGLTLVKNVGDEQQLYGRGCPGGRYGRGPNNSHREADLKIHADVR